MEMRRLTSKVCPVAPFFPPNNHPVGLGHAPHYLLLTVTPVLHNGVTPISKALDSTLGKGFLWLWDAVGKRFPITYILGTTVWFPIPQRLETDKEPALCVFYLPSPDLTVPWVPLGPQHP